MIKSIQTKIILIFFTIGIIIIGALSFLNINSLKQIETANTEINTMIVQRGLIKEPNHIIIVNIDAAYTAGSPPNS